MVEHRSAVSEGLRFDYSWELRIFSFFPRSWQNEEHLSLFFFIRFGRGSFKPDNHSTFDYFPWANMARHVSIFLWLRTSPSIWMLNLTRVPLFLCVLDIICRCLEQIVQRNWAILMSHMATFRPYLLFIVLSMWLSIRHVWYARTLMAWHVFRV